MAYDTSREGLNAAGNRQAGILADAKSGSPKGASGTYNDAPNSAAPSEATIAQNEINSHPAPPMPSGSTGDTGRTQP